MNANEVLSDAWQRNARVNEGLLDHLTPELMALSSPGGWSVAQHLAHTVGFRKGWLSHISPPHQEGLEFLFTWDDEGPDFEPTSLDPAAYKAAFRSGDEAVMAAVRDAAAGGNSFGKDVYQGHPDFFVHHTLVHDAHHRAQVLMTLRLAGHRWEEADDPMWAPWRD